MPAYDVMINHDSKLKVAWSSIQIVAVLCASIVSTYRITFSHYSIDTFYWLMVAIFTADIAFSMRASVKKGLLILTDRNEIVKHYMQSWFTLDLLAAVPFTAIVLLVSGNNQSNAIISNMLMVAALFPLLKLIKVSTLFREVQYILGLNPSFMRLLVFGFWFILAAHIMSLGWIIIGAAEHDRSPIDQYIRSLYWCTTTIATIGYGDYYPDHSKNGQIIYTICVQIVGVAMYGYIIGNIANIIANIDVAKAHYMEKMEEINNFLSNRKLPMHLQKRVRDYYHYIWETRKSVSTEFMIEGLPKSLEIEISLFINRTIIEKVPFFKNSDEIFLRELIQYLRPMVFLPDDYIISQGEHGDCMYFLSTGDAEVLIGSNRVAVLSAGSPFGETSLIQNEKRMASIRTLGYCDVYKLCKSDFDALRGKYPEFDAHIRQIVTERNKRNDGKG